MGPGGRMLSVFLVVYFCGLWKDVSAGTQEEEVKGNKETLGQKLPGFLSSLVSSTDASQSKPKHKSYYKMSPYDIRYYFPLKIFIDQLGEDTDVTKSSAVVVEYLDCVYNRFSQEDLYLLLNEFYDVAPTADAPSHTYKNNLEHVQNYIDKLIKIISTKFWETTKELSGVNPPSPEMMPRYEERMDSKFVAIEEHLISVIIIKNCISFDGNQLPATKKMIFQIKEILGEFEPDTVTSCGAIISDQPIIKETIQKYLEAESIDIFQLIEDLKPVSDIFEDFRYYTICQFERDVIGQIYDLVYVNEELVKLIHDVPGIIHNIGYNLQSNLSAVAANVKEVARHKKYERQTALLVKLREAAYAKPSLTEIYIHLRKLKYEIKLAQLERWIAKIRPGGFEDVNLHVILFLTDVKTVKLASDWEYSFHRLKTQSKDLMKKIEKKRLIFNRQNLSSLFSYILSITTCEGLWDEIHQKIEQLIQTIFDDSILGDLINVEKLNITLDLESNKQAARKMRAKIKGELGVYKALWRADMGHIYMSRLKQIDGLMHLLGITINE